MKTKDVCCFSLLNSVLLFLLLSCNKNFDTTTATVSTTTANNGPLSATITTNAATSVTQTTAASGGSITSDGGTAVTARGVCWSTASNPTTSDSKTTDGIGNGSFSSSIAGLNPGTNYHIRAYASNSAGTAYGQDLAFTTNTAGLPTLTTTNINSVTGTSASSGGSVTSDGGATVTARGICRSTFSNPTIANAKMVSGSGIGTFTCTMINLVKGNTYYVRAFATNAKGTAYGNQVSVFLPQYQIGDNFGGGIVFYVDNTGQHGLIAAHSDLLNASWDKGSSSGTQATSPSNGVSNTNWIINQYGAGDYAARNCRSYLGNNPMALYNDFYLPSKDELNKLYQQKNVVSLDNRLYWSSSEYTGTQQTQNYKFAWAQDMSNGQQSYQLKFQSFGVRPIRAF